MNILLTGASRGIGAAALDAENDVPGGLGQGHAEGHREGTHGPREARSDHPPHGRVGKARERSAHTVHTPSIPRSTERRHLRRTGFTTKDYAAGRGGVGLPRDRPGRVRGRWMAVEHRDPHPQQRPAERLAQVVRPQARRGSLSWSPGLVAGR